MNPCQQPARRPLFPALSTALVDGGSAISRELDEIRTEAYVDLDRFMGEWYVIASIPTALERNICNATETYRLDTDGTIATTFSFRKGAFDGKRKTWRTRGFVRDTATNAEWGMQFIWPIRSDYRILFVNDDYSQTIIGRNKRDFAWIMARTPTISNEALFERVRMLREQGYETDKLQLVPQRWNGRQSSYSASIARRATG